MCGNPSEMMENYMEYLYVTGQLDEEETEEGEE